MPELLPEISTAQETQKQKIMEETNETLWRSLDSNAELGDSFLADMSFRSLNRCSDSSDFASATATPRKSAIAVEEGLLDALRNLQIASAKKLSAFQSPIVPMQHQQNSVYDSLEKDNFEIDPVNSKFEVKEMMEPLKLEKSMGTSNENINSLDNIKKLDDRAVARECPTLSSHVQRESENIPELEAKEHGPDLRYENSVENFEIERNEQKEATEKQPVSVETSIIKEIIPSVSQEIPVIAPIILENMEKAVKPFLKPPAVGKKFTIGVSPILQTSSRSRVSRASSSQATQDKFNNAHKSRVSTQESVSRSSSKSSSRSSSLKRHSVKNVVATVVTTKEGVKLKEEKIKNFGIPVNLVKKKKRTQAVPFSFTMRDKHSQQEQKKQPMKDSNSQIQQVPQISRTLLNRKSGILKKSVSSDLFLNKENTISILEGSKMRTEIPKFSIEKRPKERRVFDEKTKDREGNVMKVKIGKEKLERGTFIELEVKKKIESKANPKLPFKTPASIKSGKIVSESYIPAWRLKNNK